MKTVETILPAGEILETEVVHKGVNPDQFVLVPASTLSLDDEFMCYIPKLYSEKAFKELLTEVINRGISDFYRPRLDPSFDKYGKICYQAGLRPAVGKSYNWWKDNAKGFCPEHKSRLGTKSEYVAFLGVLIKKLVASGWEVAAAWNAVCNDSRKLGHYWNPKGALQDFEPTGSREICGFCDLANAYKFLAEDKKAGGFWIASGGYNLCGDYGPPLVQIELFTNRDRDSECYFTVGWLVLS